MAETSEIDVLIIEDTPEEVERIAAWLGLQPGKYDVARNFPVAPCPEIPVNDQADQALRKALKEVERRDPRVVVTDVLLSGEGGILPFNGIEYARDCKKKWKDLGVILVTTGGDEASGGQIIDKDYLKELVEQNGVDYGWLKPKDENPQRDLGCARAVKSLIENSLRPSEHR